MCFNVLLLSVYCTGTFLWISSWINHIGYITFKPLLPVISNMADIKISTFNFNIQFFFQNVKKVFFVQVTTL